MSLNPDSRSVSGRIVLVCGAITAGMGALVLVAWVLGWDALTTMGKAYSPMPPNAALLFAVLGSAVLVREVWPASRGIYRTAAAAALLSAVAAGVTLIGFAIGLNIDDSLFLTTWMFGDVPIKDVPPVTAFCFVLASFSLLLLEWQARAWVAILGTLIALVGSVCLMGYWFGAPLLYGGNVLPVSLPGSLALMALGVGLIAAAGPDTWPLNALIGPSSRARLLRALLPTVVILSLVADWITIILLGHADPGVVVASAMTAVSFLLLVTYAITRVSGAIGGAIDRAQAERKRAEEMLRESEEHYRGLVEQAPDMIGVLAEQRLVYLKQFGARLFGAERPEQMLGKTPADYIHPDDLPAIRERARRAAETGEPNPLIEFRIIRLDGALRKMEGVSIPFAYQGRRATQFMARDITERKEQEDRVLVLNRRLRQLVEAIQKLALARDVESVIGVVCSAARRLTDADGSTFMLREGDQCFYADEDAVGPLWKGQRFPMSTCISGWVMMNHKAAVIEDIYADPRIPAEAYRLTFARSLAMVPIRGRDPLGAIGNYWAHPHAATREEVQLLQTLADATAIAMEDVQLYNEQEQRFAELRRAESRLREQVALAQLLEALARAANEAATRDEAMRVCVERICEHGRWMIGRVGTFAPGQHNGNPQSSIWHCPQPERYAEFLEISNRFNYGQPSGQFMAEVLRTRSPVWVPDLSTTPAFGRLAEAMKCRIRAGFAFPVVVNDQVIAFLEFFADEVREPDTLFLDAISVVGAQLARVIERQHATEALRNYTERLRDLSQRLLEIEEAERRNINRELHDRIGANLAALNLNLNLIRSQLPQESLREVGDRLQATQRLLEETTAHVRNVMADLHPPALEDYGLLAALRTYVEALGAGLGVPPVTLHGENLAPRLPPVTEMALFRVAQGALANVFKHAHATRIEIQLAASPDGAALTIADDGVGFDVAHASLTHASWGLATMRERAEAVGATLTVESAPGAGTKVIVHAPRGEAER